VKGEREKLKGKERRLLCLTSTSFPSGGVKSTELYPTPILFIPPAEKEKKKT